ncbi:MAG: MBL fold metallo-hydrolase [Gemmatimonadota bacterium]
MRTKHSALIALLGTLVLAVAACGGPPGADAAQHSDGDALGSYQRARAALGHVVEALGGEARLRGLTSVAYATEGTIFGRGQSASPTSEYEAQPHEARFVYDVAGDRTFTEWETWFRGGLHQHFRRVFDADKGWAHDLARNGLKPVSALDVSLLKVVPAFYPARLQPALLARAALGSASSLRWAGEGDGPPRIGFTDADGFATTLVLDPATWLPTAAERVGSDPVRGDVQNEVRYGDYRAVDGLMAPHTVEVLGAGEVLESWTVSEVSFDAELDGAAFDPPADLELHQPLQWWVPHRLADGVWWLRIWSSGNASYNMLIVEFDDHLAIVEAALSDLLYPAIAPVLASLAPGKPVRWVVPTHYHADHTNGIRAYIANGATAVVAPQMADYVRALAQAQHTLQPNPIADVDVEERLRVFEKRKTLTDGSRTMELYQVGPGPHVDEMVIVHLPEEGILFTSDLFTVPDVGDYRAPSPTLRDFARVLGELDLNVTTIVPGHGRPGTMDDLRDALAGAEAAVD